MNSLTGLSIFFLGKHSNLYTLGNMSLKTVDLSAYTNVLLHAGIRCPSPLKQPRR